MKVIFDGDVMRTMQKALAPFVRKPERGRADDMNCAIHYEVQNHVCTAVALNGYEMLVCQAQCKTDVPAPDPVCFELMPVKIASNSFRVEIDIPTSTCFVYGLSNSAYTLTAPKGDFMDWRKQLNRVVDGINRTKAIDGYLPLFHLHPDRIQAIATAAKAVDPHHVSFWTDDFEVVIWKAETDQIRLTGLAMPVFVKAKEAIR